MSNLFDREDTAEDYIINHNSIQQYFNDINKIPLLNPKEERELEINLKKGDYEAKMKLIKSNLYMIKRINLFFKTVRDLEQDLQRNPTAEEISNKMKMKLNNIKKIIDVNLFTQSSTSIENYIGKEKYTRFIEFISNEHSIYKNTIAILEQHQEITNLLSLLSEKEKNILILRFGLNGEEPLTLEEIGEHFSLTRERIRQIEEKALKKLRSLVFSKMNE
ncbi:hypothetical protein HY745_02350 [Candidatus Desantisbacteria bacterium]|nr:hypothetical protein [Candidatus Desantisbacteria bacterium]